MIQIPDGITNTVSDLARLATPIAWTVVGVLFRDIYREYRELHRDVHGPKGLGERLSKLEGLQEAHDR